MTDQSEFDFDANWFARAVLKVLGPERAERFAHWLHHEDPRCGWRDLWGHPCDYALGHSGSCHTITKYGDNRYWYGINYDHETGKYRGRMKPFGEDASK